MRSLSLCVALAGLALCAQGQFVYEPFNYPANSSLSGQGGWYLGEAFAPLVISGSMAMPPGMYPAQGNSAANNGGSAKFDFNAISSGTVYFSYAFRVDGISSFGGPLPWRRIASIGMGVDFSSYPDVRAIPLSLTTYRLAVYNGATTSNAVPTVFNSCDTLFLVGSYTFNPGTGDDKVNLWVNPNPATFAGPTPPTPNVQNFGVPHDIDYLAAFNFPTMSSWNYSIDELRIGTSWAQVTIPEPGPLAQVLMGGVTVVLWKPRKRKK